MKILKTTLSVCALFVGISFAQAQDGPGQKEYLAAEYAKENGRMPEAIDLYKKALTKEPNNSTYHYQLGLCYIDNGNFDLAITSLESAAKNDANNSLIFESIGNLYKETKKFQNAVDAYQKAFNVSKSDDEKMAYKMIIISELLFPLKKYSEAGTHIADMKKIMKPENESQVLFLEAQYLNVTGKYTEAIANLTKITASFSTDPTMAPEFAGYYYELGYAMHMAGDYAKADKILQEKANFYPYKGKVKDLSAEHYLNLAKAYFNVKEDEKCQKALDVCLKIKESYKEALDFKTQVSTQTLSTKKLEELSAIEEKAIKEEKDPATLMERYRKLAVYQFEAEKYNECIGTCNKILELKNTNTAGTFYKALALARVNKAQEGIELLSRLVTNPQLPAENKMQFIFCLGLMYKKLGDTESAFAQFKKLSSVKTMYTDASRTEVADMSRNKFIGDIEDGSGDE